MSASAAENLERAIVSGATSGIGRAVAVRLARRGAIVAILGRDKAKAELVAAEVKAAGGTPWTAIVDIVDMVALSDVVARFAAQFGGIDTVVSSAGIASTGTLTSTEPEEWHRIINTNLNGTYFLARAVMPDLIKTKGAFVAISSDAGVQGAQGYAAYATSKHALHGLIKCMALDYGPQGVRSHAVCPAFVETPMADALLASATPEEVDFFKKTIPLGRFAQPYEVADAVAHLTSAEAAFANGVFYRLDGGATAGYFLGG
jgi:meso-butanediol dehydrogenase / (S,S)-butanediol dehydrogenase / diacetyl reductase